MIAIFLVSGFILLFVKSTFPAFVVMLLTTPSIVELLPLKGIFKTIPSFSPVSESSGFNFSRSSWVNPVFNLIR